MLHKSWARPNSRELFVGNLWRQKWLCFMLFYLNAYVVQKPFQYLCQKRRGRKRNSKLKQRRKKVELPFSFTCTSSILQISKNLTPTFPRSHCTSQLTAVKIFFSTALFNLRCAFMFLDIVCKFFHWQMHKMQAFIFFLMKHFRYCLGIKGAFVVVCCHDQG